jgi:hypothetical protein
MRSVMRMRHYCDHCKKSTGTKPAMVKHEKGCTANPVRVCGICNLMGEVQKPIEELLIVSEKGFKALSEACHGCPCCILASDRQGKPESYPRFWEHPSVTERGDWDFKTAMKQFWIDYNEEHRDPRYAQHEM